LIGRSLLHMSDISPDELHHVLRTALAMKRDGSGQLLAGRTLALLFEKPSLRTRVSFDMAMFQLGGRSIYLSPAEVGLGTREAVSDVARVLGRQVDAIAARVFAQETLSELSKWSGIPIINALSDDEHPCQALADLLTIYERRGTLAGVHLAYIGDGNNVARSLAFASAMAGMTYTIAAPSGYELDSAAIEKTTMLARENGGAIRQVHDPVEAVEDADFIYTDAWFSMGEEMERELRRPIFWQYQINDRLLSHAPEGALVMHDLPAHRGEEITDEVLDGPRCIAFDQAENRRHAQKAVLALILSEAGDI
jgi:ornithine carbamoyltransferase